MVRRTRKTKRRSYKKKRTQRRKRVGGNKSEIIKKTEEEIRKINEKIQAIEDEHADNIKDYEYATVYVIDKANRTGIWTDYDSLQAHKKELQHYLNELRSTTTRTTV